MTKWVRASGADAAAHLVDLWNANHKDKIELATIPDNQMVTKLATRAQAGGVPDLVSFDLIYMPEKIHEAANPRDRRLSINVGAGRR
jgi:multiple sugar transport system substrate-binding protein